MGDTKIGWTEKQWSVTRGCERISPGCGGPAHVGGCYAEKHAGRFCGDENTTPEQRKNLPFYGFARRTKQGARWTGVVKPLPENLDEPLRWKNSTRCFVNSMSDLFHKDVPFEYIAAVFGVMAACPHITFQVLTKRADVMVEWFKWVKSQGNKPWYVCVSAMNDALFDVGSPKGPEYQEESIAPFDGPWPLPNVELGVSAENQKYWDERVPLLEQCPAVVRWVSVEPMLGQVDISERLERIDHCSDCHAEMPPQEDDKCTECGREGTMISTWGSEQAEKFRTGERYEEEELDDGPRIHWLVVGGESGNGARPMDLEWADQLIQACKRNDVAAFFKQTGSNPIFHVDANQVAVGALMKGWPCGRKPVSDGVFRLVTKTKKGTELEEAPPGLRVREYAKVRDG